MPDRPTVLFPVRILDGESVPEGVPELLAHAHVLLLGYHVVPEQTAPGQARLQFEDQATDRLASFEELLVAAGATVDSRLVFTHDRKQTIRRMVREHDCLAVLAPASTSTPESALVVVQGTAGLDRLVVVVAGLFAATDVQLTLCHVTTGDESVEDARTVLDGVTARLRERGVDRDAIHVRRPSSEGEMEAILEQAADFDVVILRESNRSPIASLFDISPESLTERLPGPVIVVQREPANESEP